MMNGRKRRVREETSGGHARRPAATGAALPAMLRHGNEPEEPPESDEDIENFHDHRPRTENHLDEVNVERSDEAPVESSNDDKQVRNATERLIAATHGNEGKELRWLRVLWVEGLL